MSCRALVAERLCPIPLRSATGREEDHGLPPTAIEDWLAPSALRNTLGLHARLLWRGETRRGLQVDYDEFKAQVGRVVEHVKAAA